MPQSSKLPKSISKDQFQKVLRTDLLNNPLIFYHLTEHIALPHLRNLSQKAQKQMQNDHLLIMR